jgi:hypothetical protein
MSAPSPPLPSVFSLPPAERRQAYDAAHERAMEAAHEAAVASKARNKPDPHAGDYLAWRTMGMVCVLVVKHRDKPASFECSRDGGPYRHLYLPFSQLVPLPESDGEFLLALLPRPWVNRIEKKDFAGAQPLRELFGVTLPLSAAQPWTDEQCATWERLGNRRLSINSRIQSAKARSISNISRTNAA